MEALSKFHLDDEIILSSDAEGNSFYDIEFIETFNDKICIFPKHSVREDVE